MSQAPIHLSRADPQELLFLGGSQMEALPDVRQRYNDLGIVPAHSSPDRMLELVRTEIPQMAKILAAIGLKPE